MNYELIYIYIYIYGILYIYIHVPMAQYEWFITYTPITARLVTSRNSVVDCSMLFQIKPISGCVRTGNELLEQGRNNVIANKVVTRTITRLLRPVVIILSTSYRSTSAVST